MAWRYSEVIVKVPGLFVLVTLSLAVQSPAFADDHVALSRTVAGSPASGHRPQTLGAVRARMSVLRLEAERLRGEIQATPDVRTRKQLIGRWVGLNREWRDLQRLERHLRRGPGHRMDARPPSPPSAGGAPPRGKP
jgi:hypothetical protein